MSNNGLTPDQEAKEASIIKAIMDNPNSGIAEYTQGYLFAGLATTETVLKTAASSHASSHASTQPDFLSETFDEFYEFIKHAKTSTSLVLKNGYITDIDCSIVLPNDQKELKVPFFADEKKAVPAEKFKAYQSFLGQLSSATEGNLRRSLDYDTIRRLKDNQLAEALSPRENKLKNKHHDGEPTAQENVFKAFNIQTTPNKGKHGTSPSVLKSTLIRDLNRIPTAKASLSINGYYFDVIARSLGVYENQKKYSKERSKGDALHICLFDAAVAKGLEGFKEEAYSIFNHSPYRGLTINDAIKQDLTDSFIMGAKSAAELKGVSSEDISAILNRHNIIIEKGKNLTIQSPSIDATLAFVEEVNALLLNKESKHVAHVDEHLKGNPAFVLGIEENAQTFDSIPKGGAPEEKGPSEGKRAESPDESKKHESGNEETSPQVTLPISNYNQSYFLLGTQGLAGTAFTEAAKTYPELFKEKPKDPTPAVNAIFKKQASIQNRVNTLSCRTEWTVVDGKITEIQSYVADCDTPVTLTDKGLVTPQAYIDRLSKATPAASKKVFESEPMNKAISLNGKTSLNSFESILQDFLRVDMTKSSLIINDHDCTLIASVLGDYYDKSKNQSNKPSCIAIASRLFNKAIHGGMKAFSETVKETLESDKTSGLDKRFLKEAIKTSIISYTSPRNIDVKTQNSHKTEVLLEDMNKAHQAGISLERTDIVNKLAKQEHSHRSWFNGSLAATSVGIAVTAISPFLLTAVAPALATPLGMGIAILLALAITAIVVAPLAIKAYKTEPKKLRDRVKSLLNRGHARPTAKDSEKTQPPKDEPNPDSAAPKQ